MKLSENCIDNMINNIAIVLSQPNLNPWMQEESRVLLSKKLGLASESEII